MDEKLGDYFNPKKKMRQIDREQSAALFLLRATQLGLSMSDLDLMTVGMVQDLYIERANDECEYSEIATQSDFDNF